MPRIRHWFHVSHDINSDGEVWELTDRFGVSGLRVWLELLSIADRNEGGVPIDSQASLRQLSIKCNTTQRHLSGILEFIQTCSWIIFDPSPRIRNWAIYNPKREHKKSPDASPPLPLPIPSYPILNKKNHKNDSSESRKRTNGFSDWPSEDQWLKDLIGTQVWLNGRRAALEDFSWWNDVATSINGIQPEFIEPQFGKMSAWLKENPARNPTTKGIKRFIRRWLERAREKERTQYGNKR